MIRYLYGEDIYGAQEEVHAIAKSKGATIRYLDDQDLKEKPARVWADYALGGFLGGELVVFLDASNMAKHMQEDVVQAVSENENGLCIVWDKGRLNRRSIVWKRLKAEGKGFSDLPVDQTAAWLCEMAQSEGGEITHSASRLLVQRLGVDRWRLCSELLRLLLISEHIDDALVQKEVEESFDAEIFTVLQHLAGGRRQEAMRGVEILLGKGASEFYLLSMLAYLMRTMTMIRSGIDRGLSQHEIARVGQLQPFVVQKDYATAQGRAGAYWRDGLARVAATDFSIKQGRVDARTGVLMLVASL